MCRKASATNYKLTGSSLSRKLGFATFVHEGLQWTLHDQSPAISEIKWLCVDTISSTSTNLHLHGCKHPTSHCSLTPVKMRVISTVLIMTGVTTTAALMENTWLPGQVLTILSFSITSRMKLEHRHKSGPCFHQRQSR